jgi:hypothetical protein
MLVDGRWWLHSGAQGSIPRRTAPNTRANSIDTLSPIGRCVSDRKLICESSDPHRLSAGSSSNTGPRCPCVQNTGIVLFGAEKSAGSKFYGEGMRNLAYSGP